MFNGLCVRHVIMEWQRYDTVTPTAISISNGTIAHNMNNSLVFFWGQLHMAGSLHGLRPMRIMRAIWITLSDVISDWNSQASNRTYIFGVFERSKFEIQFFRLSEFWAAIVCDLGETINCIVFCSGRDDHIWLCPSVWQNRLGQSVFFLGNCNLLFDWKMDDFHNTFSILIDKNIWPKSFNVQSKTPIRASFSIESVSETNFPEPLQSFYTFSNRQIDSWLRKSRCGNVCEWKLAECPKTSLFHLATSESNDQTLIHLRCWHFNHSKYE